VQLDVVNANGRGESQGLKLRQEGIIETGECSVFPVSFNWKTRTAALGGKGGEKPVAKREKILGH